VERGFVFTATPRSDDRVIVVDERSGERVEGALSLVPLVGPSHWSNYPLTVARRVAQDFPEWRRGLDLAFSSDLPPAAGLSSSSALVVGTFLALAEINGFDAGRVPSLSRYLGAVENGVGTHGGSEDHFAILRAEPDALIQFPYEPTLVVPLPHHTTFVVAASGVLAAKTGGALGDYNRAAARAASAVQLWRTATGDSAQTLGEAFGGLPDAMEGFRRVLHDQPTLLERVEQFHAELEIMEAAGEALRRNDLQALGELVDRSQANAERWLHNQVPETISLARQARELGAMAASAFGAGFGGSVYALVRSGDAEEFAARWRGRYVAAFPSRSAACAFFVTRAGRGARRMESPMKGR
jgi:galactokinase